MVTGNFPVGQGEIFGSLAWTWEDDRRADWEDPSLLFQNVDGINQTDVVVGYRQDSWRISAYVENVFDELWYDGGFGNGNPNNPYAETEFGPARPLTAGVRFGIDF